MFRLVSRSTTRSLRASAPRLPASRFPSVLTVPRATAPLITRLYSVTTSGEKAPAQVDELSTRQYHRISDEYLETLVDHLETLSEDFPQIDAEYSQGVLTLELPPSGTYVINKQPPNKQIWVSSPVSGPDRFDPVDGKWISLRTGVSLGDILRDELHKALGKPVELAGIDDE